jgi:hypothetical protein
LRRILQDDLSFHPSKIKLAGLLETDKTARVAICRRIMGILDADVRHRLIAFDEAHFYISGYVNKQNYRYWRDEQPHSVFETLLHSLKVAVWCGLSASGITGLHFFEEGNCALTVT